MYAQQGAVQYLGKRYFAGRSPLFTATADHIAALVSLSEQMVELYNDWLVELGPDDELRPTPGLGEPIDLADVKQRSGERATAIVEQTVRLAKAETLIDGGDRRSAALLVQEHL